MTLATLNGDRSLWAAVITQALDDATARVLYNVNDPAKAERERQRARRWFTRAGRDFRYVCGLADLDPAQVQAFALQRMNEADASPAPVRSAKVSPERAYASSHERGNGKAARRIRFDERELTINEWAEVLNVRAELLRDRLRAGWSIEATLTTPINPKTRRRRTPTPVETFHGPGGPVRPLRA